MTQSYLQIDFSKSKRNEDLIEIKFQNDDVVQVNFSKLVCHSKYIRDKYKYSEALQSIQQEIDEVEQKMKIREESIKYFLQLIQDEKIDLPIDYYKDIYSLSEYFSIAAITTELDNIKGDELFNDLNFPIQILHDSESENNGFETKLIIKIENFLIERINECIENDKFRELPIATIYRIIEKSKGQFDHNLLLDFILESAQTRFTLFKFIDAEKVSEDKVDELIKFIDEQDESTKKIYLDNIKFDLKLIKKLHNLQNKYDQLIKSMNQPKEELNQTNEELNKPNEELNKPNEKLNQTNEKSNQTNEKSNQTNEKSNQTNEKLNQPNEKELEEYKTESNKFKDVFSRIKNEKYTQSIVVGGSDLYNELGEQPNYKTKYGNPIIHPPLTLYFDPSSFLSYSTYSRHTVLVMSDGSLKGIGDNRRGVISSTLQKKIIDDFTDFCIKDDSGQKLSAFSAVCSNNGTLYMLSKNSNNEKQLVYCDSLINGGDPVFLDIGNHQPVSLFGGADHSAAIGSEGEVIFINRDSVINSPNSPIEAVFLPEGEKASSVACCTESVFVLSSNGRVFKSLIVSNKSLDFSPISELSDHEIVCVSGTNDECFAVSKEGRVFGCGYNYFYQKGDTLLATPSFRQISLLKDDSAGCGDDKDYKIRAVYAGFNHLLFETSDGEIISAGCGDDGQLLSNELREKDSHSLKTKINSGATFCIAGNTKSVVFIESKVPENTPNMRIQQS